MLTWLSVDGTAAIVEFPGVLYHGGAEQKIRKYLIDGNYIDAVIQLPPDLFFGVTIATCIIVLKKSSMPTLLARTSSTSRAWWTTKILPPTATT
jgi:type I restriction enzyme M protein